MSASKAELFFTGSAQSWNWKIVGGPCDQSFAATTGNPPQQSFTLTGANSKDATVHFTLSGDYTVTLTIVDSQGNTETCTWIQHVVGPGLRFELCWDHTGSSSQGGADLDLHVHEPGSTTNWFSSSSGDAANPDPSDCNYMNCTADNYSLFGITVEPAPNWGYTNSAIAACSGSPDGLMWQTGLGACHNPRLDMDNIDTVGVPENTNIDNPQNGQTFRAMVHYYGQDGSTSTNSVEEHPIVNIYCGGTLKATYGQAPDTLGPCPGTTCFNSGAGWNAGQMWRVADVTVTVDAQGNTTDCTISAIHPSGATSGYLVTTNVTTY